MNIEELKDWLTEEIIRSEEVLKDPFLLANMQHMDLGIHSTKIEYYTKILNKITGE